LWLYICQLFKFLLQDGWIAIFKGLQISYLSKPSKWNCEIAFQMIKIEFVDHCIYAWQDFKTKVLVSSIELILELEAVDSFAN